MSLDLHSLTAVGYLAAAVVATIGLAGRSERASRAAVLTLAGAGLLHAVAFLARADFALPPPSTGLLGAVSLMVWLGVVFTLVVAARSRLQGLVVGVAPAAFVGVFFVAVARPVEIAREPDPAWGTAHVLLASAGLALLGVAAVAGLLFLLRHRSLKARAPGARGLMPPLEALDRVNVLAVPLGFLLLTLGVVTGILWVHQTEGTLWSGGAHATATLLAWAVYAIVLVVRLRARRGARQSAVSAVAGFALLLFAMVGAEVLL